MPSQTEKDTAKAQGRVTRSEEFQKRVDAGGKSKASTGQKQPAAEGTRKASNKKNRTVDTQRDTDRAQSRITRSAEYQRRIDAAAEAEQVGTAMEDLNFVTSTSTAGGGGLPAYPGDAPDTTDGILVYDDTNGEGRWLQGYEETEGIICIDGVPISGKILFNEDP